MVGIEECTRVVVVVLGGGGGGRVGDGGGDRPLLRFLRRRARAISRDLASIPASICTTVSSRRSVRVLSPSGATPAAVSFSAVA